MSSLTPRVALELARAEFSRLLGRVLVEEDVHQRVIAAACGVPKQHVQDWTDPEDRRSPQAVHLRLFPRAVAIPLFRYLLEPHEHAPAPVLPHETVADDLQHLSTLNLDSGELEAHFARTLASGRIDPDDAKRGIELAQKLAATAAALERRFEAALEARGDQIRRVDRRRAG